MGSNKHAIVYTGRAYEFCSRSYLAFLDHFGIILHFSALTSSPLIHCALSRQSVMALSKNSKYVGHLKQANSSYSVYPNDKHKNSTHFLLHKEFLSKISQHALFPCDSPINCCFEVCDLPMHNKASMLRIGCNSSRHFQDSYSRSKNLKSGHSEELVSHFSLCQSPWKAHSKASIAETSKETTYPANRSHQII